MSLNERSLRNLEGVHPDLVRVVKVAAEKEPFLVTEGLRNLERQRMLVKAGKSKTLNSRHLTGHAVDVCDSDGCYDIPDMGRIAEAMKAAASELNIPIDWGGDWKWKDTPHFELNRKAYPASGVSWVDKAAEALKSKKGVATTVVVGTEAAKQGVQSAPDLPKPPSLGWLTEWTGFADGAVGIAKWGFANPVITGALALWIGICVFAPKILEKTPWAQSSD